MSQAWKTKENGQRQQAKTLLRRGGSASKSENGVWFEGRMVLEGSSNTIISTRVSRPCACDESPSSRSLKILNVDVKPLFPAGSGSDRRIASCHRPRGSFRASKALHLEHLAADTELVQEELYLPILSFPFFGLSMLVLVGECGSLSIPQCLHLSEACRPNPLQSARGHQALLSMSLHSMTATTM